MKLDIKYLQKVMDFCLLLKIQINYKYNLRSEYSKKLFHRAKIYAIIALKTISKRVTDKTAEATGDLIGIRITDKVTKLL